MRAERSVIGTRRSSCVASLKVIFIVEHEEVMRARDKKKEKKRAENKNINTARDRGRSDAAPRLVLSMALRGSLHYNAELHNSM